MWASNTALAITAEDKAELERIVRSGRTEQRHALRARIANVWRGTVIKSSLNS
jgi:hypothetical protein